MQINTTDLVDKSINFQQYKRQSLQSFYLMIQKINKIDWRSDINQAVNSFNLQQFKLGQQDQKSITKLYKKLQDKYQKMQNQEGRIYWLHNQLKIFVWLCIATSKVFDIPFESYGQTQIKKISTSFLNLNEELAVYQYKLLTLPKIDEEWTMQQDTLLMNLVKKYNYNGSWTIISKQLFLESQNCFLRASHTCRQRWQNHLDTKLNKGKWTLQEDYSLIKNIVIFGKKWSIIAKLFDRVRNEHMIKNRYNFLFKKQSSKKLIKQAEQLSICKLIQHKLFLQLNRKDSNTPTLDGTTSCQSNNTDEIINNNRDSVLNNNTNKVKSSISQIHFQQDPLANSIKFLNQNPDKFFDIFFQKTVQSSCFKIPQLDSFEIPDELKLVDQDFNQSYPILNEIDYQSFL